MHEWLKPNQAGSSLLMRSSRVSLPPVETGGKQPPAPHGGVPGGAWERRWHPTRPAPAVRANGPNYNSLGWSEPIDSHVDRRSHGEKCPVLWTFLPWLSLRANQSSERSPRKRFPAPVFSTEGAEYGRCAVIATPCEFCSALFRKYRNVHLSRAVFSSFQGVAPPHVDCHQIACLC